MTPFKQFIISEGTTEHSEGIFLFKKLPSKYKNHINLEVQYTGNTGDTILLTDTINDYTFNIRISKRISIYDVINHIMLTMWTAFNDTRNNDHWRSTYDLMYKNNFIKEKYKGKIVAYRLGVNVVIKYNDVSYLDSAWSKNIAITKAIAIEEKLDYDGIFRAVFGKNKILGTLKAWLLPW